MQVESLLSEPSGKPHTQLSVVYSSLPNSQLLRWVCERDFLSKNILATAHQVQNNLFYPTSALISSHTGSPRFLKHTREVPASGPLHLLFCLPRATSPTFPTNGSFSSSRLHSNATSSERPSLTLHRLWLPPSPGELHHTLLGYFFTVFISQPFVLCNCFGVPLLPPHLQSVFMSRVGDETGRHTD